MPLPQSQMRAGVSTACPVAFDIARAHVLTGVALLGRAAARVWDVLPPSGMGSLKASWDVARVAFGELAAGLDILELGQRAVRNTAAVLTAASHVLCHSATASTHFLLSDRGRLCASSVACGAGGAACLCLSSHPNWGALQTESVVGCAVSVGAVVTAARHLELSSHPASNHHLVAAGAAVGAALGRVLVHAYDSLQRAKVPLHSFLLALGGMALLVDGAIILSS